MLLPVPEMATSPLVMAVNVEAALVLIAMLLPTMSSALTASLAVRTVAPVAM